MLLAEGMTQDGHSIKTYEFKQLPQLEQRIETLLAAGEHYRAYPYLCNYAMMAFVTLGPEHPATLESIYRVLSNLLQRGVPGPHFCEWVLPRAVVHWGIDSPKLKKLIQHLGVDIARADNPKPYTELTTLMANLAQHLPGGLGWGPAAVTPTDENFNKHVALMHRAEECFRQGNHELAQKMQDRIIAFFDALGPHWLGSQRKVYALHGKAKWTGQREGHAAAESVYLEAKRVAQRELGPDHEVTQDAWWRFASNLVDQNRKEQALGIHLKVSFCAHVTVNTHACKHKDAGLCAA